MFSLRRRKSQGQGQEGPQSAANGQSASSSNAAAVGRAPKAIPVAEGGGLNLFGAAAAEQAGGGVEGGLLRLGAEGPQVTALQQRLVAFGQQIAVDGDFGRGTEAALRAVQAQLGVDVDGVAGPRTLAALSRSPSAAAAAKGPARGAPTKQSTPAEGATAKAGADPKAARAVLGGRVNPAAFERSGLRPGVFAKALDAFQVAWARGDTKRTEFTIIDYELPSDKKRMWVIDLATGKLLFHERVAHGRGSDTDNDGRVDRMGNTPEGGTSNVGLLKTAETYQGKHGLSLRLDGLERGFNDNARRRAVVVHSADYVDEKVVAGQGRAGRSLGCPALDPDVNGDVIRTIKGGALIFGYWPDPDWLKKSRYLNGSQARA